jgi:hypothetical protein
MHFILVTHLSSCLIERELECLPPTAPKRVNGENILLIYRFQSCANYRNADGIDPIGSIVESN